MINTPILKHLKELVQLTQANSVLSELSSPSSKTILGLLYRTILDNPDASDEEIAVVVYGPETKVTLPAFRKLKTRLRNLLIDALISVEVMDKPDYSTYVSTYQTLQRQYASAQLLLSMRAYHNCVSVLERVYRTASKYDFTEIQYQVSQRLMSLYTGVVHHPKKFEFYHQMCLQHQREFIAQGQVNAALSLFKHHINNRLGDAATLSQIALDQAEIINEVVRQNPNLIGAELTYFNLKAHACFLSGDFAGAIQCTQRGEDRYLKIPIGMPTRLYVFRVLRLRALGLFDKLQEGKNLIQVLEESVKPGSINWLDLQETKIGFYLKFKMYDEAYVIADLVNSRKLKNLLSKDLQQGWELLHAFMHLLFLCGQTSRQEASAPFRLSRFLNSVPSYSKEKRRMNVQILIVHTLLLIVTKQYDKAIDRVEALEKYCSRYLSNNDSLRSNCFIKMLTGVIKGNFHLVASQRHAERYRLRLVATQLSVMNQIDREEIIPYEDLWGILQNHLGQKVIRRR